MANHNMLNSGNPEDQVIIESDMLGYVPAQVVPVEEATPKKPRKPRKPAAKKVSQKDIAVASEKSGKPKLSIEQATQNRYSMRNTPERQAMIEQARAERLETDAMAYREWNEQNAGDRTMDSAFEQTILDRKINQFEDSKEAIYSGSAQVRRAFYLAEQIRQARAKFDRLLSEGVEDARAYREQVTDREDALEDILVKNGETISQEQQDFLIMYAGGDFNDLLEVPASIEAASDAEESDEYANMTLEELAHAARHAVEEKDSATFEKLKELIKQHIVEQAKNEGWSKDQFDGEWEKLDAIVRNGGSNKNTTPSQEDDSVVDEDLVAVREELKARGVGTPEEIVALTDEEVREIMRDVVFDDDDENSPSDSEESKDSPEDLDESEDERNLGDILSEIDPDFYQKFSSARKKYVNDQARSRGATVASTEEKTGVKSRLRRMFKRSNEQSEAKESFKDLYSQAIEKVRASLGSLPKEELRNRMMLIEGTEAHDLEWEISTKKLDSAEGNELTLSRRLAMIGTAAAAGATTAILERMNKGTNDHWPFLAIAGLSGALAGAFFADKYKAQYDESMRLESARAASGYVKDQYEVKSPNDSMRYRAVGLEAVEDKTKQERNEEILRRVGSVVIGGAVGMGSHWLVDMLPHVQAGLENKGLWPGGDGNDGSAIGTGDATVDTTDASSTPEVGTSEAPQNTSDTVATDTPKATETPQPADTADTGNGRNDGNGNEQITDLTGDESGSMGNETDSSSAETGGTEIWIDEGNGPTQEMDQYIQQTYGVDPDSTYMRDMYDNIFSRHEPGEIFTDVDFYTMKEDGRQGFIDSGPAQLTQLGKTEIGRYIAEHPVKK